MTPIRPMHPASDDPRTTDDRSRTLLDRLFAGLERLRLPLALAVLAACGWWLAGEWEEFSAAISRFRPGPLPAALVLLQGMLLAEAWGWRTLMAGFGQRLPGPAALRIWSVSQLGQYLPGTLWFALGRVWLATRAGAAAGPTAAVVALDAASWVTCGLLLTLTLAPAFGVLLRPEPVLAGAAAAVVVAFAIAVVPALRRRAAALRSVLPADLPFGAMAKTAALQALAWSLDCAVFVVLASSLLPIEGWDLVRTGVVFQAAGLIATLVFILPHGVGVQELLLMEGLEQVVGPAAAPKGTLAAIAVAMRVVTLAGELVLCGLLVALVPAGAAAAEPAADTIRPD